MFYASVSAKELSAGDILFVNRVPLPEFLKVFNDPEGPGDPPRDGLPPQFKKMRKRSSSSDRPNVNHQLSIDQSASSASKIFSAQDNEDKGTNKFKLSEGFLS